MYLAAEGEWMLHWVPGKLPNIMLNACLGDCTSQHMHPGFQASKPLPPAWHSQTLLGCVRLDIKAWQSAVRHELLRASDCLPYL